MPLNILVLGESKTRLHELQQAVNSAGHHVVALQAHSFSEMEQTILQIRPDFVLIDYTDPLRDSLEQFCYASPNPQTPLLVLGQNIDQQLNSNLRDAGLAVYADSAAHAEAVQKLLPVIHFMLERQQQLTKQINDLECQLEQRKAIEQAKDALAAHLGISSQVAYQKMREQAMQQRRTLFDLAQAINKHYFELSKKVSKK